MSDPKYRETDLSRDHLIEKIGKVLQTIGEGERFGWNNHHPNRTIDNLRELRGKWVDLKEAYADFINDIILERNKEERKKRKLEQNN